MRVRGLMATTAMVAASLGLPAPAPAVNQPARSVTVEGPGTSLQPSYDAQTRRFGVGTGPDTDGTLTVTASTADPQGSVLVDGHPVPNGAATTVERLSPGDEVNVQITDAAGTGNQSFVYLPPGFPRIRPETQGTGPDDGMVLVGLASYLSDTTYQTALDRNGVPVYVSGAAKNHDFKPSAGHANRYTVAHLRPGSTNEDAGYRIDELDGRFRTVASHTLDPVRTIGLRRDDTDFHDVELTDDGRVVLVGYQRRERADGRTWLDAIIQVTDRRGEAEFTWSSKGHIRPSDAYVLGSRGWDYAHLNSVQLQPNGDIVASFRNVGQVLRIATERRGPYRPGDVVWRLGGERNEFTFLGDPYGGFCAQHDVRVLPDGHLLMFDNGAQRRDSGPLFPQTADMCPDPAVPTGPRIARPQSRVAEYALDVGARTATLVWSHEVPGRYAAFAGSAQRLGSGHTLVGWWNAQDTTGASTPPLVSEVDTAGSTVWSLTAEGWFSYRAHKADVPDRTRPRVQVHGIDDGDVVAAGSDVAVDVTCTDRGGSNLATCTSNQAIGGALDTSPGAHTLRVTATDGAGNSRTRRLTYTAA